MLKRPTALLEHTRRDQHHYDWLLADPRAVDRPDPALWAARTDLPSGAWRRIRRFDLLLLPPHRTIYLTYQGPIAGDRGVVRRVDAGWLVCLAWTDSTAVLDVHMRMFAGRIRLARLGDRLWRARVG